MTIGAERLKGVPWKLAQEVALQPLADLAGRDDHAEAGEVDQGAIGPREALDTDGAQVELPLEEAEEVVHEHEAEDQRQVAPLKVAEAVEDGGEVGVGAEADEDEDAEDD